MVNRVLRDDPSKGDMHNRQGLSFKMFWETLSDYHMWPVYIIGEYSRVKYMRAVADILLGQDSRG